MKRKFFYTVTESLLAYSCTTSTLTNRPEKKLGENYKRILQAVFEQILEAEGYGNSSCTATYLPSLKLSK